MKSYKIKVSYISDFSEKEFYWVVLYIKTYTFKKKTQLVVLISRVLCYDFWCASSIVNI